jgi:hypothetical protein
MRAWFNWVNFVKLKSDTLRPTNPLRLNMEEQPQDEKHIYTKNETIGLYAFFFVWGTMAVVILSVICGMLPKHYILYTLIQGLVYFMFHKLCKHLVDKNIKFFSEYTESPESIYCRKMMSDDFGTTVTNSYRLETNFYSGSSFTSSTNTYILNNIINK